MITRVTAADFGPYDHTDIEIPDAFGWTEIAGPSQSGKSTLVEIVLGTLLGVGPGGAAIDTEAVRDGADKLHAEVAVSSGTTVSLGMTRRRSATRAIARDEVSTPLASREALLAKLGPVGQRPDVSRLVIAPMEWRVLLEKDLGRPLRDLLVSILQGQSAREVVRQLMAQRELAFHDSDAEGVGAAEKAQTGANAAKERAIGALSVARSTHERANAALVHAPEPSAVEAARAILAARDAWASAGSASEGRAKAQGFLAAARAVLDEPKPELVSDEKVAKAARVREAERAWTAYNDATARRAAQLATVEQARAARDEVRRQREALGPCPPIPVAEIRDALAELERISAQVEPARVAYTAAETREATASRQLAQLEAHTGTCPTCGQDWAQHAGAVTRATEELTLAREALQVAGDALRPLLDAQAACAARIAELRQQEAMGREWEAKNRAIGPDPSVPVPPAEIAEPAFPRTTEEHIGWAVRTEKLAADASAALDLWTRRQAQARKDVARLEAELAKLGAEGVPADVPRPTSEEVTEATAVVQAATEAGRTARALAEAQRALAEAEGKVQAATAEAVRCQALVECWRRAPSEIARAQVAALGDMGPVTLRFPPKESKDTPEIEVLVDGRSWRRASHGRIVLADLYLRAAIRRAAGLDALPIIVDGAQDWSGAWPMDAIPGPVWLLRTTPDGSDCAVVALDAQEGAA